MAPLRVWLAEIGEPLPTDPGRRPMRCGLLAEALVARGHDVTWWASTFDHVTRAHRLPAETTVELSEHYRLRLAHAPGYRRSQSLARIRHHRRVAAVLARRWPAEPPPDLVFSCVPTLEVSERAVVYGAARGVPVVLDVRDLWPDVYLHVAPRPARPLIRAALAGERRRARRALGGAVAVTAVSEGYLEWALRLAGRERGPWDAVFPHGYPRREVPEEELWRACEELRAAGVDEGRIVCCFVGTFGRSYDLGPLITTATRMARRGDRRAQFVLAGDGDHGSRWRAMARGLPNVVFTGWLPPVAIAALLDMADLGVAAYATGALQGLPNKIYEYLSAGLPILSSLPGEAQALLAETGCGVTYSPGDVESFESAILPLLESEAGRREMADRSRSLFGARFRENQIYPALAVHLERLAAAAKG